MKQTKYYCDICGRNMGISPMKHFIFTLRSKLNIVATNRIGEDIDVCEKCAKEIYNFVKGLK